MKEKYQLIRIRFSNGKSGSFMGKAIVTKEDIESGVTALLPVEITEAKDLPEGMSFGTLED